MRSKLWKVQNKGEKYDYYLILEFIQTRNYAEQQVEYLQLSFDLDSCFVFRSEMANIQTTYLNFRFCTPSTTRYKSYETILSSILHFLRKSTCS